MQHLFHDSVLSDYKCGHAAEDGGAHREAPAGEAADTGRGQEATRGARGAQCFH